MFYAVVRREKEKCEPNRCIEVVRIGCEVIQQPDPSLRMVDAINGLPTVTKQNRSRKRQEATLLCRRHAVLCGIDFQRAVRREGTCFDDDADYYPSYAAARSVGRFAKKRAASLISSIRRPGNVALKVACRVDARRHALIRRCTAETEISRESWPFLNCRIKITSERTFNRLLYRIP